MQFHKQTFDRIPEEKRSRIMEIAVSEFATKGYDNANMNSIAEKAGISVGSLYKYFDSKESFFLCAVYHGIETLDAVMKDVLASQDGLLDKAERIVRLIQRHSRQNRDLIRLYNELTSESNSDLVKTISKDMEVLSANAYTALIRQAQEQGLIRSDLEPDLYAFFVDSMFMILQFSYTCEYYQERFKIYAGEDVLEQDERVVKQFLGFLKAAFT